MARKILVTLLIFVACATSLKFDFDDDFFDDFETTDKRGLQGDGKSPSDGETIFVSESTNKLNDGRETITKESVKWVQNPRTGKWSKKRSTRHFVRLQNGTVLEIEDNGSGEAKSDGEMTKVDCINEDDCKDEQFCDSLSYACRNCLRLNETCHWHKQCCKGSLCRDGKCEEITGKESDPCESDKDCKANHCCAYDNGKEMCKPYLAEGDDCGEHHISRFPSFFATRFLEDGKKSRCPCLKGLKCQLKQSFFLYNKEICVKQKGGRKKKTSKREKRLKRKNRKLKKEREEDMNEMEEDREEDMDFIPANDHMEEQRMPTWKSDEMHGGDEDNEDDDDEEEEEEEDDASRKRRLEDKHELEEDNVKSIFDSFPTLLKGLFRGILNNFE